MSTKTPAEQLPIKPATAVWRSHPELPRGAPPFSGGG
jgi:hypothetical protein